MHSFLDLGLLCNLCFYTDFVGLLVCVRESVSVSEANRLPRLPF